MSVIVITGGSRGIGASAAVHCARRGMGVILTYKSNVQAADSVVQRIKSEGGHAVALELDVSHAGRFGVFVDAVRQALQSNWQTTTLGGLVNNAGHGLFNPLETVTEAQFDDLMNVHLKGPFFLTQKLLALLVDGGRIINISSGLARFSLPGYAAYASMKGAVEVLSRYQAKELGPRGITVNTLAPGAIATDFGGGAVRDNNDVNAMVANNTALGRAGLPDDIGGAISILLADGSHWITGQRIEASGGMFL